MPILPQPLTPSTTPVSPDPNVAALMQQHGIPYQPLQWPLPPMGAPPWQPGEQEFFSQAAQQGLSYKQARAAWDAQQRQRALETFGQVAKTMRPPPSPPMPATPPQGAGLVPPLPPAEDLLKDMMAREQQQRAGELMQQAATPALEVGPVWQGDLASYGRAAQAARDQAMAGQLPTLPGTYMPLPVPGSPESYAGMPGGAPPPATRPSEGRFSTMETEFRSEANRKALADAAARLRKRRGAPLPVAKRQELVTAHRRGETPSQYRVGIETASPTDIALLAGPGAAQVHPQVLGPMLEAQQREMEGKLEAQRLAALASTLAAGGQEMTPEQMQGAAAAIGLPMGPAANVSKGAISETARREAKAKSETRDQYEQNLRAAGVSADAAHQDALREFPESAEESWGDYVLRTSSYIPAAWAAWYGLLDVLPSPRGIEDSGVPSAQIAKVERLAREGSPEEQTWAKRWLDEYRANEAKREKLRRATRGSLGERVRGSLELLEGAAR